MGIDKDVKLLRHRGRIDGIIKGRLQPPVMTDVDPVNGTCNLDCAWCCQAASRQSQPATFMSVPTMQQLGPFSAHWGVKAWRISSDSEPLLNKHIDVLLESGHASGIDMGLITNGVYLHRPQLLGHLAWLGVSLDATTASTWSALKRAPEKDFHRIIANIKAVRARWPALDVSIKFLRWRKDENLGKDAFGGGVLPIVDQPQTDQLDNAADAEHLQELADRLGCRAILKDAYPQNFPDTYRFTTCLATPLGGVFGADHRFHLCCDARSVFVLTDDYTRGDWGELPRLWGGQRHWQLIRSIEPGKCAGCAKHKLNEILEHVVLDGTHTHEHQVNFI